MVNWWKSSIEEQGGEQAGARVSNLNLLDNPNFLDPINQRGQTEYKGNGYNIDRFRTASVGCTVTLRSNGVKFSTTDENGNFFQHLDPALVKYLIGKTVTFSCLTGDVSGSTFSIYLRAGDSTDALIKTSEQTVLTPNSLASTTFIVPDCQKLSARVICPKPSTTAENYVEIKAVKVELGSVQTLAHKEGDTWVLNDPPPNKALELLKCQRYFRRIKSPNTDTNICAAIGFCSTATNIVVPLSLGAELRTRPTVSYSSLNDIQFQVNNAAKTVNPTNVTVIYPVGDVIDLHFTVPNVDIGPAIMRIVNAGYIDLDANL